MFPWAADFGAEGFDITDDMDVNARIFDADFDSTIVETLLTVWLAASSCGYHSSILY